MSTDVVVALIAAAVALIAAVLALAGVVWTAVTQRELSRDQAAANLELQSLKHQQEIETKQQDRQLEARAVLDHYRKPLLGSAVELKRRIGNIRHNRFLGYLESNDHRAEIAVQSTLYRLAAYLGWREVLARHLTYMDYEDQEETKLVVQHLEDVGTQLATDRYDFIDGRHRLMLWKEEQRAVGGLMATQNPAGVIGFELFTEYYDDRFAQWLDPIAADLRLPGIESSERLKHLADSLERLITNLDIEKVYAGRI
jgi:hypothetical protein